MAKSFLSQAKQKSRRQRIHLSRIFATNDGKQIEPVLGSDFERPLKDDEKLPGRCIYQDASREPCGNA